MGAKLCKEYLGIQNHEKSLDHLPLELDFLSYQILNAEFNKLYLKSREQLQAITENPSKIILMNINQRLTQNSKFLVNCFSEPDLYQYDIIDMFTDHLVYQYANYKVPGMEAGHINRYISSKDAKTHEKQRSL